MDRDVQPFEVTYDKLSTVINMPGWYCSNCEEAVFVGKDMDIAEKARFRLKAQAEGLLLPEEIRLIRKKLALTQEDAGAIIGGGPNAFHKYESGLILPTSALSNLLRVLEADPHGLDLLRQRETTKKNVVVPTGKPTSSSSSQTSRKRSAKRELASTR
jgi:HTH-type transcriptional regulator/antitoxin MqsA